MSFFKFLYLSAIDFGIQWSLWGLASWLKTEKFYDLAGIQNKIIRGTYSLQCFNDVRISCRLVDVCFAGICGLPEVLQWSSSCQNSNSSYPRLGSSVSMSYSLIIYKFFLQVSLPKNKNRLGFYLFSRVLKQGHDRRFKDAKEDPSVFFVYWTLQGIFIL